MAKRKREEESVEELYERFRRQLQHALSTAKGFERQRLGKRLRDPKSPPGKIARLQREVEVLKTLDLASTASAQLSSALLRFKSIAESPGLPESIKAGPRKKVHTSEGERAALHNVTSSMCGRREVREVMDQAIAAIAAGLGAEVPVKKGRIRKDALSDERVLEEKQSTGQRGGKQTDDTDAEEAEAELETAEQSEPGSDLEEHAFAKFDDRVGSSSGSDSDDDGEDTEDEKGDDKDPMEISSAEEVADAISTDGATSDEEQSSDASSDEGLKPPVKGARTSTKKTRPARTTDSPFLPTLLGGYISGSESEASDIDLAPPARKNRRGQQARRAIAEKKYKDKAKHLEKEARGKARDAGWDVKRGATDGGGKGRKPWQPASRNNNQKQAPKITGANMVDVAPARTPKPPAKDDTGPLHASWEAKKKAKEKTSQAVFQGKKIVF